MELDTLLRTVRKRWISIVTMSLLGLLCGFASVVVSTPIYQATAGLYISVTGANTTADLAQGGTAAEQKVNSFLDVATSSVVLQPVIDRLHLDETPAELRTRVTAQTPVESVLMNISVRDTSPEQAAKIANAIGASLAQIVSNQLERPSGDGSSPIRIQDIDAAVAPTAPVAPSLLNNATSGLALGLLAGFGLAALRSALDTRLSEREDVERESGAPVIGTIGFDRSLDKRPLLVHEDPRGPRAEAFRRLRTNVSFLDIGSAARSFVVSSSVASEGKTTTTANLALTLAESGARVVLVDGDLRRPRIAKVMGIEGSIGLTDVLIGRLEMADAIQEWGTERLAVLPAGHIPPNPTELLGSSSMQAVINHLTSQYDFVLIDAPPLLPVTDAALLAKLTSGALLVAAMNRTSRRQLRAAAQTLNDAHARCVGSIMNMVKVSKTSAYEYAYAETTAPPRRRAR